jgi:hypothetical protein
MRLTDEHVAIWEREGYVVVEDFLTGDELKAVFENFLCYFPTADDFYRHRPRYRALNDGQMAGVREFPFSGVALNDTITHPEVISFAERVLGTTDVHCTHGQIWAKYAGASDYHQELHCDYPTNTLVYPREDGKWRQVLALLYLTDVTPDLGPTGIVSRPDSARFGKRCWPPGRQKKDFPELYAHEVPVIARAGSLLLYSMSTWHRGTAMLAREGCRFSMTSVYRHGGYEWMGWRAWPREGLQPAMKAWLMHATPRQRAVIGFPAPGHPYWTAETLEGTACRYPKMDMTPYREALREAAVLATVPATATAVG